MFLYDTSIMKIKAGGFGDFLSYTEKNKKDHSQGKLVYCYEEKIQRWYCKAM